MRSPGWIVHLPLFFLSISSIFCEDNRPPRSIGNIAKFLFGDRNQLYDPLTTQYQLPLTSTPVIGYRIPMPPHFFYPQDHQALFPEPYFPATATGGVATAQFFKHPSLKIQPTNDDPVSNSTGPANNNGSLLSSPPKKVKTDNNNAKKNVQNPLKLNYNLPPPPTFYTNNYYPPTLYPYSYSYYGNNQLKMGGHLKNYYTILKPQLQKPPNNFQNANNGGAGFGFKIPKNKVKKPTIAISTTSSTSTSTPPSFPSQRPFLAESVPANQEDFVPYDITLENYGVKLPPKNHNRATKMIGKMASMVRSLIFSGMRFMTPDHQRHAAAPYDVNSYGQNGPILVQDLNGGRRSFNI